MNRLRSMFLFLLVAMLLITADAIGKEGTNAVLSDVKGEVLLFQGDRYLPVKPGQRVADSDRLMIMEKSEVHVVFDNDCEVTWDGAKIVDIDVKNCPTIAGLWVPCLGTGAGTAGDAAIILTQLIGSALVRRDGQYITAEEGQVLEEGDVVKLDGEAEINYEGACVTTHNGKTRIEVSKDSCPIAELSEVKGKVLVDEGKGFSPVAEGYKLKDGVEVDVPKNSHVKITYFNGCDEAWDGKKIVGVDAAKCPIAAGVPVGNCTPAVFGNMTSVTVGTFIGTGVVLGLIPGNDDNPPPPPPPPPPVSP